MKFKLLQLFIKLTKLTLCGLCLQIAMPDFLLAADINGKSESLNAESVNMAFELKDADIEISGKITDEFGDGLPGASILIAGTSTGTTSDVNGNYKINAPEGATLIVSFVGFRTQEVPVNNRSVIDIQLEQDLETLQEIVVIGYGTTDKKDLTGSIVSVKGDDLQKTPANTFVQSLQGRAAGVDVRAASNAPGGGIRIRVRGTNSITSSSDPLYVIDGFPIDNISTTPGGVGFTAQGADPMSSISPNDIASIEILKDASATAIYGARGANGVIIITTKRGKTGKAKIDFDYSLNVQKVRKTLELANARELAILRNEWTTNQTLLAGQPVSEPFYNGSAPNRPLPEELGEGTDWQDEIFRTALTHTYGLSMSGGNENTKYLLSGNYLNQEGIIIESEFQRAGVRFNLDQKVSDKVKFAFNLTSNRSVNNAVPSDGGGLNTDGPLWNALTTTPVIPVRDEDGNFVHNHDQTIKRLENPVSIATTRTDQTTVNRTIANANIDYEIIKGLTLRATLGGDILNSKRNIYFPSTQQSQNANNHGGIGAVGSIQSTNWLSEYTATYKKNFGPDHELTFLAGYMIQVRQTESALSESREFFTDLLEFNNLGVGANPRPARSNSVETGLLSYTGRLNYKLKNKYIFTGTVRRDGSSKFGADNKWGVFPSGAFAWRLGDEGFMQNIQAISDIKVRTSYGLTGNQNIRPFESITLYQNNRPIIGGGPVIGLFPNKIPNPNLKWERTTQFDVGLDLALFDGRFSFSADYYVKTTKDLLLNVPIPSQSGYGRSTQNVGEVENKGFELTFGYNNNFGQVTWNSSINVSLNRNKVLALPEGTVDIKNTVGRGETRYARSIIVPGQPLGSFYGYRFDGIWDSVEEINAAGQTSIGGKVRVGLPQYRDLGGAPGWNDNDEDREIIGDPNPDFIYGFSNDFTYKNFNLSIFINGSYGNDIANLNSIGILAQPQKHNVLKRVFDERWTGPGTSTTIEAPLTNAGEWKNFSDREIEDGSFLRVKTISLTYNLPVSSLGGEWLRSASVFVAADNLVTITNYTGFDPEVDSFGSATGNGANSNNSLGIDTGSYPVAKGVRFGVKLGF